MIRTVYLAVVAIFLSTAVQATTIDFEAQAFDSFGSTKYEFNENGIHVTIVPTSIFGMYLITDPADQIGTCNPKCASNGTAAYYGLNQTSISFDRGNGDLFSLASLDAAQTFTGLDRPLTLTLTGVKAEGIVTSTIFVGAEEAEAFSTFTLEDFVDLSSLTITGGQEFPEFAIDNVVLLAAAVPEPSSWAMQIAGFGVIGGALRQRRRTFRVA